MRSKTILTDCDGVLLNWEYAFEIWMDSHGYKRVSRDDYCIKAAYGINHARKQELIRMFNESAAMGFLPPLRDAVHYVKLLHEKYGFMFEVITSMSTDPYAVRLREMNLQKFFGTAISNVICLDTGADKDEILHERKKFGAYWVEDKVENADLGAALGMTTYLMEHEFNMDYSGDAIVVKNWQEIANNILMANVE